MITEQSNREYSSRTTVKVGDLAIIHGAITTSFWKTLFQKRWRKTLLLVVMQWICFSRAIMAFQMWALLRYKPGGQTMGIVSILASLCFGLAFNSTAIPSMLAPLAIFAAPFLPIYMSPDELFAMVFIDIQSPALLIYQGIFLLASLIHLNKIWFGRSNESLSKRGDSWIYAWLAKRRPINEFFICGVVEPGLIMGLGALAWGCFDDQCFGLYLILIASAEAIQQILDKAHQLQKQALINA